MKQFIAAVVLLVACGKDKADENVESVDIDKIADEVGVDFARKHLADIDAKLASSDPGAASSVCAVIEPDLPAIKKADAKLYAAVTKKCGRDLAVRSLAVFVERIEAERAKDPSKRPWDCSSLDIYLKHVVAAKADAEPEVVAIKERYAKACPPK